MIFSTEFLTAVNTEITTDPETLGYSGKTPAEILEILNTQRSLDPQEYAINMISPQEIALILIKRNKWKAVKDIVDTSIFAFSLVELASLPGITVDWTGDQIVALLTGLVNAGALDTDDTTALRDAARIEKTQSRRQALEWPILTIQNIEEAIMLFDSSSSSSSSSPTE